MLLMTFNDAFPAVDSERIQKSEKQKGEILIFFKSLAAEIGVIIKRRAFFHEPRYRFFDVCLKKGERGF